jgi:poly-beta-1,6-N-acetyl-D-glucosamine synthase
MKLRLIAEPVSFRKIAFLVPGVNEEKVIAETLTTLLAIADAKDIYVVSDGSRDSTVEIAKKFTANVLDLQPNRGKAGAMNYAIEYFNLANNYEFLMPIDADTKVTADFLKSALPVLEKDTDRKITAVVGKVLGSNRSWVTTFRLWEYEVAQSIHKAAQSIENAIVVCPGVATVYRAEIFQKIKFPYGTMTEDMDLTFQIHRKKLGKIVYVGEAVVITQDP